MCRHFSNAFFANFWLACYHICLRFILNSDIIVRNTMIHVMKNRDWVFASHHSMDSCTIYKLLNRLLFCRKCLPIWCQRPHFGSYWLWSGFRISSLICGEVRVHRGISHIIPLFDVPIFKQFNHLFRRIWPREFQPTLCLNFVRIIFANIFNKSLSRNPWH